MPEAERLYLLADTHIFVVRWKRTTPECPTLPHSSPGAFPVNTHISIILTVRRDLSTMRVIAYIILLAMAFSGSLSIERHKFHTWLPYYEYIWKENFLACQPHLHRYYTNTRDEFRTPCAAVVNCLLTNVTESVKSDIASADILLGIAPQIIAFAGPTSGELAVLSTHDPVFTSLLLFGFPSRPITGLFCPALYSRWRCRGKQHLHLHLSGPTDRLWMAVWGRLHATGLEHLGILDSYC